MEFAEGSVLQEVEKYPNMMVLKTFSKAFGLAAARLGFAVSNKRSKKPMPLVPVKVPLPSTFKFN